MIRNEAEVFEDLKVLCQSAGYVHALANLSFRDNMIAYSGDMSTDDMMSMFSPERLIRSEISTLMGLMIQSDIDWKKPSPEKLQILMDRTEVLLKELHGTFLPPMAEEVNQMGTRGIAELGQGDFLREMIFYGGESAYSFQYRDFAQEKYTADDKWLQEKKGFSILEARTIAQSIKRIQEEKFTLIGAEMATRSPEQWSILSCYAFSTSEIASVSDLPNATIEAVLNTFTLAPGEKNQGFRRVDDFNIANANPLLRWGGKFVLFQFYSLVESLYESPFYWMAADKSYESTAMRNRGLFTESLCHNRLEFVFGRMRVYKNVNILGSKARKAGEIDVLVLFGDRAVIVQAKSKRLTLESRRGNDGQIKADFKKSVQDSYDQGLNCAQMILDPQLRLIGADGDEISVLDRLKEIYILCVVADNYPALHFQSRQFLKYQQTNVIRPPMVMDVFTLDAIAEMLSSPLRFISYINRRVSYSEQLIAAHETVILSYHLKKNLWMNSDIDMLILADDISVDLDIAMAVRRDGVTGLRTPDGVLTRLSSTAVGRIITTIENRPDPGIIDFGLLLLSMSEGAILEMSSKIEQIAELARKDGETHDLSICFKGPSIGFTVHCSADSLSLAIARLRRHCELRMESQYAKSWFGVCVHPDDCSLRFGFKLDHE